jgi:hypothetical protein
MVVKRNMKFSEETVTQWQSIWAQVCDMAYLRQNITEKIRVEPVSQLSALHYTRSQDVDELTLDHMWKTYSKKYADVQVVPELKELYVPAFLFNSLGVKQWFDYSFPNCEVMFW